MMCTDRQIVERMLVPSMMQVLLTVVRRNLGQEGDETGLLDVASAHLVDALREPIESVPAERRGKLVRRAKRATEEAMGSLEGELIGVQLLAVARLVARLSNKDVILVGAESAFAKAWDIVAALLDCAWDELDRDSRSDVASDRLWGSLSGLGYYPSLIEAAE